MQQVTNIAIPFLDDFTVLNQTHKCCHLNKQVVFPSTEYNVHIILSMYGCGDWRVFDQNRQTLHCSLQSGLGENHHPYKRIQTNTTLQLK